MNIKNKHIVIAGGTSGLGFAIAALALKHEATVTILGRSKDRLAVAAERLGSNTNTVVMDIGDSASAHKGFQAIGPFDHFVSTVADLTYGPLASMERDAIERMLAGKFWGPVNLVQHGVKNLSPDGSILLFSGLAADRPGPGTVLVSALNAGIEGFTRALAVELAPIRVNSISPGVTNTEAWSFMDEATREDFFAKLATQLPARRVGQPEHLAEAALFALSNDYLTGEILHVNGGGTLI